MAAPVTFAQNEYGAMWKILILGALLLAQTELVAAQDAGEGCKGNANALGVSRTIEIDTTDGPKFGQLQYHDNSFLKPGEVVLTFDDGPLRRNTRRVLEALAAHCTRATFFLVGRMAVADPAMVKEIASHGHTIGTHTWSHANLRGRSTAAAEKEFELGISAIRLAAGKPIAPFFRYPYLADTPRVMTLLKQRNIASFSIDADSKDFRTPSGEQMRRNILNQLGSKGRGILLFHDIQTSTARGIHDLLNDLKAKKYHVVHLVAKQPVATVANYDAVAEKLLAGKPVALAGVDDKVHKPGVLVPVKPVYTVAAPPEPTPAAASASSKGEPGASESDWRRNVFGQE